MLRKHARSASGLCIDSQISGTRVCPQSANDDRPKLRHSTGAVGRFAGPQRYVRCATPLLGAHTAQHNTAAEDASHRIASHRIATAQRTCLRKSSLCSSDVAVRSLRKSSCSGTIGSDSGSDAIM